METQSLDLLNRIVKWSFNPRGRGPDVLRTIFVVVPAMLVPIVILTGGLDHHFWLHYIYSVLLGDCVALVCTVFTTVLGFVGYRILKVQVPRRTFALASAAGMAPGLWIAFRFVDPFAHWLFGTDMGPHTLGDYGMGLTIGGLIFTLISLCDLWLAARSETERLRSETLQAKLSALSAQLNPHLLFNALNTIASTIPSDPHAAEETTLRLSELYRGILTSSKRASHRLSDELDLCRAYLGIESARFGDRLSWTIEADPALEGVEVPALLIQPLVENAIKHGVSQKAAGGKVTVRATRTEDGALAIEVEDDGVGLGNSTSRRGTGTGVSSCRARLELLYPGRARFEIAAREDGPGTRVRIRIPIELEVKA